jgi:hypothetical protein
VRGEDPGHREDPEEAQRGTRSCGSRADTGLARLDREWRAVPDLADVDATAGEFVMGRFDVGDDQPSLAEPGAAVVSPWPNVTEAAEPGGVNWTMRRPSGGATSSSSLQPRRS